MPSPREPIPPFPLPLRPWDSEPTVDLKPVLDGVYDRAGYVRRVNYRRPPDPPLSAEDAAWAEARLSAMLGEASS